jgi:hypothetical protein
MANLELTDEQTDALIRELSQIIENDRYPLSPRIVALKEILGMMRPEPDRPHRFPRHGITSRRAKANTGDDDSVCTTAPAGPLFSVATRHQAGYPRTTRLGWTRSQLAGRRSAPAVGGLIEAFGEVLDLGQHLRMALAAWSPSIIVARWKCATAPATASRRGNVSRRRALAKAQPQCRADGRS